MLLVVIDAEGSRLMDADPSLGCRLWLPSSCICSYLMLASEKMEPRVPMSLPKSVSAVSTLLPDEPTVGRALGSPALHTIVSIGPKHKSHLAFWPAPWAELAPHGVGLPNRALGGRYRTDGRQPSTTVRVMMRNEREREKRKRMSMGTRSAGAGEVRPGAQAHWVLSSPASSPSLSA